MPMSVEEMAAYYYHRGWWSLKDLEALVAKGKLTEEAVRRIVGAE